MQALLAVHPRLPVVEIWIIDTIRKLRVDGKRNNMARHDAKPREKPLEERLRLAAMTPIGPRLVPYRVGGVSPGRQVAVNHQPRGGRKKRKNGEEPLARRPSDHPSSGRSCLSFPTAFIAFLTANSRGVRVFIIVDLNRAVAYPFQGERERERERLAKQVTYVYITWKVLQGRVFSVRFSQLLGSFTSFYAGGFGAHSAHVMSNRIFEAWQ